MNTVSGRVTPSGANREGTNVFLVNLDVTIRREERTGCPRIIEPGCQLACQQTADGEYYYSDES